MAEVNVQTDQRNSEEVPNAIEVAEETHMAEVNVQTDQRNSEEASLNPSFSSKVINE